MKKTIALALIMSVASVASLSLAVCSMHPQSTRQPTITLIVLVACVLTLLRLKERIGRFVIVAADFALVGVNLGDHFHNRPALAILCASLGIVVAHLRPRWLLIAIVASVSAFFCHLHASYVDLFPKTNSVLADYVRWALDDPIVSSVGAVVLMVTLETSLRAIERAQPKAVHVSNGNSNAAVCVPQ